MKYPATEEGYLKARKYLLKMGFTPEKLEQFDGFSLVHIANHCRKAKKKLTGILPDGTMF